VDKDDINHLAPLLLLAVRQLDAALLDASAEAELLSRAVADLGMRGAQMRDSGGEATHAMALSLVADSQRAMRALQFHDRLSQRVNHVRDALLRVHGSVSMGQGGDWPKLNESIRSLYTMQDERQIFDALVPRAARTDEPCEEAERGSVELF
jgi:hypothetical protein